MPNVDSLIKFIKADNVRDGDIIHFCDGGQILAKDFEDKQTKMTKTQDVLEMEVMVNEEMKRKIYSPNSISRNLLKAAWGPQTENWVGKSGYVQLIPQMAFGKITQVLVVMPCMPANQGVPFSPTGPRMATQATGVLTPNPNNVEDPNDIKFKD